MTSSGENELPVLLATSANERPALSQAALLLLAARRMTIRGLVYFAQVHAACYTAAGRVCTTWHTACQQAGFARASTDRGWMETFARHVRQRAVLRNWNSTIDARAQWITTTASSDVLERLQLVPPIPCAAADVRRHMSRSVRYVHVYQSLTPQTRQLSKHPWVTVRVTSAGRADVLQQQAASSSHIRMPMPIPRLTSDQRSAVERWATCFADKCAPLRSNIASQCEPASPEKQQLEPEGTNLANVPMSTLDSLDKLHVSYCCKVSDGRSCSQKVLGDHVACKYGFNARTGLQRKRFRSDDAMVGEL